MTKKIKRPCIRGLKEFSKGGCPEKGYDKVDGSGCPAWKEYTIPPPCKSKGPITLKDCIDGLSEYWQFEALKLLEGNQAATESFRNNMSTATGPKPDPALVHIATMMENQQKYLDQ
ncbi:MAG: hypothetical protein GY861_28340 [bacterium]|nr:hypothetical protein [bacterium]